jgi:Arc/MetJ-type ribon-helix-helix transcriptional regulator
MSVMPKVKISVTIEKTAVEWLDAQVKTDRFRNRSHAIEVAVKKLKEADI